MSQPPITDALLDEYGLPEILEIQEFIQTMNAEEFQAFKFDLLQKWEAEKIKLDSAKEMEMLLRKKVVAWISDPEIAKGAEYIPLGNGYRLKIEKKINLDLVKNEDTLKSVIAKIKANGPDGDSLASQILKWKPELSVSLYNSMPESYREIAKEMVESKPSTPTVAIEEPKAKKTAVSKI